ncbi:MAG: hypothetical protein C4341_08760 [Armatimonadota bacterium]
MLLQIVFTVSAFTTFSYPGGTLNEFVSALSEASGKSVVIFANAEQVTVPTGGGAVMQSRPAPVAKGEARWEDDEEMLRAVTTEWNFAGALFGDVMALWPKAWPDGVLHEFHADAYRDAFERLPPTSETVRAPVVSFKTTGRQALLVADARYLPGCEALEVHWFYAWTYVSICAKDAHPQEVLAAVAAACGAKLVQAEHSTSLAFDPREFRKRYIAKQSQKRASAKNDYERATADFVIEALRALSDEDLNEAFSHEDGSVVRVVAEESALMAAFRVRIASIESLEGDPRARVSLLPALRSLRSEMDLTAPLRIEYVNPNGVISALVRTKSGATIHF